MLTQSCSEVIILDSNIPNWADIVSAVAPSLLGLFSLIIAIVSILYTKKALLQQKEQWVKDAFIKREAEIIMKCREFCDKAIPSAIRMITIYMSPDVGAATDLNKFITIKDKEISKFKEEFYKVEELVRKNRQLFAKYNLYDKLNYFHFLHYLLKSVPEGCNKKLLPFGSVRVRDLDRNIEEELRAYRPESWFIWVFLTYNHGQSIFNANPTYCRDHISEDIIKDYRKILYKMETDIESLYEDFDRIMIIDKPVRNTLPPYLYSFDFQDKN